MTKSEVLDSKKLYSFSSSDAAVTVGIFASYDLVVHIPTAALVEVGRFSLSVLSKLRAIPPQGEECHFKVGAFCEAGRDVIILGGGEHQNDTIFNFTFGGGCDYFREFIDDFGQQRAIKPSRGVTLGDNVLVSQGAKILDGAFIGDGCVIGAGAVVTGRCEANSVCVGVPARRVKERLECEMLCQYKALRLPYVRAHDVPKLPSLIGKLSNGQMSLDDVLGEIEYMDRRPKLFITGSVNRNGVLGLGPITGFAVGEDRITDEHALKNLNGYFRQFYQPGHEIKWTPDVFYALGLS